MTYHYEFGIFAAKQNALLPEDAEPEFSESKMVLDMREVINFYRISESVAPNGMVFKNITSVVIRDNCADMLVYYPYKLFKQLYQTVMGIDVIMTMPYPSE